MCLGEKLETVQSDTSPGFYMGVADDTTFAEVCSCVWDLFTIHQVHAACTLPWQQLQWPTKCSL